MNNRKGGCSLPKVNVRLTLKAGIAIVCPELSVYNAQFGLDLLTISQEMPSMLFSELRPGWPDVRSEVLGQLWEEYAPSFASLPVPTPAWRIELQGLFQKYVFESSKQKCRWWDLYHHSQCLFRVEFLITEDVGDRRILRQKIDGAYVRTMILVNPCLSRKDRIFPKLVFH